MNKKSLKLFFRSLLTKLGEVKTDKAVLKYDGDGELEVGMEVFVETEADDTIEYVHPEDGEYVMEDGRIIVVKAGIVEEIKDKVEEMPAEMPAEPTTESMVGDIGDPLPPEQVEIAPIAEEPVFDAEVAYKELLAEIQTMKAEIQGLKDKVNSLLEVPAEEDAFAKQTKVEKKGFLMKCKS